MALPTVGRVVYWHGIKGEELGQPPKAAIVAGVNADGTINLGGFHSDGTPLTLGNTTFVDEGQEVPENRHYATWMPYQLAAAKKELLGSEFVAADKQP